MVTVTGPAPLPLTTPCTLTLAGLVPGEGRADGLFVVLVILPESSPVLPTTFTVPAKVVVCVLPDTGEMVTGVLPGEVGVIAIAVPVVTAMLPPVKVPWLSGLTKVPLNVVVPVAVLAVPVAENTE